MDSHFRVDDEGAVRRRHEAGRSPVRSSGAVDVRLLHVPGHGERGGSHPCPTERLAPELLALHRDAADLAASRDMESVAVDRNRASSRGPVELVVPDDLTGLVIEAEEHRARARAREDPSPCAIPRATAPYSPPGSSLRQASSPASTSTATTRPSSATIRRAAPSSTDSSCITHLRGHHRLAPLFASFATRTRRAYEMAPALRGDLEPQLQSRCPSSSPRRCQRRRAARRRRRARRLGDSSVRRRRPGRQRTSACITTAAGARRALGRRVPCGCLHLSRGLPSSVDE